MGGPPSVAARLLVSVPESPELRQALDSFLPPDQICFAGPTASGPWPSVEAWLLGSVERELPAWTSERTPRLRFVQRLFTGLDDFPFERFPPEVAIAGNVGAYAPFVAEHALALLLALTHNVLANAEMVRAGRLRPPVTNRFLVGRTVLVLGYGAIGHELATRLRPLGARLEGLTRSTQAFEELDRSYDAEHLEDALGSADVVIDCRPLTRGTRGSINRGALARMRPAASYVNVGRAGTVDEAALYEHLSRQPEFRAALDVWWDEDYAAGTLRSRFPFAELPNFLGSPHVAGVGAEAKQRSIELAVKNLRRFFSGEAPLHLADRADYMPTA
ncbi:MAG: hypothetical protein L3K06_04825 [Thermoplasmata archaeon]|nr:hypothetical protein [Thermoplasmata archaeon]MCI4354670.1 hypothetical protein [Thermoplasmata archaeon]